MVNMLRSVLFHSCSHILMKLKAIFLAYIAQQKDPSLERLVSSSEIVVRNVTMKDATNSGSGHLQHLLVLDNIQKAEVTDVTIMNNRRGAIALYDSFVVFRGNNTLSNNSAVNGGGIALYGNSYIYIKTGSRLDIINNTADELGGGVFIGQRVYSATRPTHLLPLIIADRERIHLEGNKAGYTGSDLYGTTEVHRRGSTFC